MGENSEWRLQNEVAIPCTGYATKAISIVEDSPAGPSVMQIQAIVDVVNSPTTFRNVIANAIFTAYVDEIRPQYFRVLAEDAASYGVSLDDLPEIQKPDDVWSFITGLHSVWVSEDAMVDIQFNVTFDREHELHVQLDEDSVDCVWME